jgi:hypothetical protein
LYELKVVIFGYIFHNNSWYEIFINQILKFTINLFVFCFFN